MAKFTKPFLGVPNGEIYPVQYEKGDEVPAELLDAAKEAGCVSGKKGDSKQSEDPPSDNKQDGGTGNEYQAAFSCCLQMDETVVRLALSQYFMFPDFLRCIATLH